MMKRLLLTFAVALLTICSMAQVPAFPGAEGFARLTTTGGRGGKIIHVTNLNDSGEGSLRAAISTKGARIVVFDVSGIIHLNSDIEIKNDDLTILGQTAPGDGICIADYSTVVKANNVIIRFLRFRRGNAKDTNEDGDCIWGRQQKNIIIDHCSMSWSIDECASFYDNMNFTMQWCTLGESLNNAGHGKGAHGYGGIWGGRNATFHHNLLIHHTNRTPRLCGSRYGFWNTDAGRKISGDTYDAVTMADGWTYSDKVELDEVQNCVIYNWGTGNGAYGGMGGHHNIVNNYYKYGPATSNQTRVFQCSEGTGNYALPKGVYGHFYINGNYVRDKGANYDWQGVITDNKNATTKDTIKNDTKYGESPTTLHTAEIAFDKVLAYAGASYRRDTVDKRYATETMKATTTFIGSVTKKAGIIDSQEEVGGWPTYEQYGKLDDTDGDGMPDVWETANGLNSNDAADASAYTLDSKGYYTNIEVYANALVEDLVEAQNAGAEESIDEYYPATKKADGVAYYDGSAAKGGYADTPDTPTPAEDGDTFTVTFNGKNSQSTEGFFTFNPDKHNFNAKFTGSYNGTDYTSGLKMEGATLIQFTTTATSTVTIVQSTWSDNTLKFDDSAISVETATVPDGSTGVRVYTVNGVAGGTHTIKRGSGESGVFTVIVKYGESTATSYIVTYKGPNGEILGTKKVYEGDVIGATPYTKDDLTIADGFVFWGWAYADGTWVKSSDKVTDDVTVTALVLNTQISISPDKESGYYIVPAGDAASLILAFNAASSEEGAKIFLPNGTYDLGETTLTTISGTNVSLIGESADKTIIRNAPPVSMEGLGKADLLVNTGTGLYMQDLTLKNDLDYYTAGTGRAPTLHDQGTKTICKNVRQLSYQDTYYSHKAGGLFYFDGGEIHGTVDYICGNGTVYFNGVTLVNEKRNSATISANSELYVFNNCTVENNADEYNFGRAWSGTPVCVYLNTTLKDPSKLIASRWYLTGINTDYFVAGEYGTKDADGTNITPASNNITFTKENTALETILQAEEVAKYTIDKVLGTWAATAQEQATQLEAPDAVYAEGNVTWTPANNGATAYLIEKNREFVGITTGSSMAVEATATDQLTIRAANARGGFGEAKVVSNTTDIQATVAVQERGEQVIHNLQGVRVTRTGKGVYIINGKKVVR